MGFPIMPEPTNKRVLLLIIDALATRTAVPTLKLGGLPNLKKLVDHGTWREESISIFPSLTPAATSTIITGKYPYQHEIFGFHWYDRQSGEVAYHGDDFWMVAKTGFAEFFDGCLRKLNTTRLSCDTLYQILEREGRKTACLNFLIYRGDQQHQARIPLWFSWHPDVPFEQTINGPQTLFFGDLVDSLQQMEEDSPERKGGLLGRFGFNDQNTGRLLEHFAREDLFPDFTIAYFPDHDYQAHEKGLEEALPAVQQVDTHLGRFFDHYGGAEEALKKFYVVVTGDHSQSNVVAQKDDPGIDLESLLSEFPIAASGSWDDPHALKICPDMRAAQIYHQNLNEEGLEKLSSALLTDPRVDQVLWRQTDSFEVTTSDRGRLKFKLVDKEPQALDSFGNGWKWEGDLRAVDATIENGKLHYDAYPNAFERIVGGLEHDNSGDLWVTARPGYEFTTSDTSIHAGGGSHGSLHRLDSLSPLIVGGVEPDFPLPPQTRLVDVAPLCLRLLRSSVKI